MPWGAVELGGAHETHMGVLGAFLLDDLVLLLPREMIRREFEVREKIQNETAADADGDTDAPKEETF